MFLFFVCDDDDDDVDFNVVLFFLLHVPSSLLFLLHDITKMAGDEQKRFKNKISYLHWTDATGLFLFAAELK